MMSRVCTIMIEDMQIARNLSARVAFPCASGASSFSRYSKNVILNPEVASGPEFVF
jgi:hypothetical protein